ncbi:MAG: hypothetical protein KGJ23_13285 [Euryarchaeota archaeon]|nr:hypothetical protein [Euryarchaeota archaeon]MDE1837572.1 hypothetical protein [Euryarchaeota archaeon]MDE1881311.1 hypothetical protein [Euryarchaeota archaeon]MDE2045883.1 hypothetical protein [Thermoplasmata archaeon]
MTALEEFAPTQVAIGLAPEELHALQQHFSDPYVEPWVPLASSELAYARGIARFGAVRVPSPAFLGAIRWAAVHGVALHGVEPPDETYSELFVEHVGYFELLRRTLSERSLQRNPPLAEDSETFALAWEARSGTGAGSRRLGAARVGHARSRLREVHQAPPLAAPGTGGASLMNRVALLVDVERFPGLLKELAQEPGSDLREAPRASEPLPTRATPRPEGDKGRP